MLFIRKGGRNEKDMCEMESENILKGKGGKTKEIISREEQPVEREQKQKQSGKSQWFCMNTENKGGGGEE